jgi:aminoglycoside phosphotransferase (APT) family kinase protein
MQRLPHGYTNGTTSNGTVVVKRYVGPDAELRMERERGVLGRLQGRLPVPPLLDAGGPDAPFRREIKLGFVHGEHGQDLLDDGRAAEVLNASGQILARIHELDVTDILPGLCAEAGEVLVHGDFGPNNLLFGRAAPEASETLVVVAILDWEWAHVGQRIEDLAWCEWLVRMHHPREVGALGALFAGYGAQPAWAERQAAMLARCQLLITFCERYLPEGDGVALWQRRAEVTAAWAQ